MTDSINNSNNFNLQQIIDKVKALVTPEKRAEILAKAKTIWAVINEKPVAQEKIEENKPNESEENKP